jgi:hypothetical protein
MAAPTFAELQQIRDAVPTTWTPTESFDDAAVFQAFSRTGSVEGTVEALTRRMLTGLLSSPDTFSISGEYSQSNSTAIAALREQLKRATADRIEWENETQGAAAVRVREIVRSNSPGR